MFTHRSTGRAVAVVAVVVALLSAGCTPAEDGVAVVDAQGVRARRGGVEVVGGPGVAPEGTRLTLATSAEARSELPDIFVALSDPVIIELEGRQPGTALTVSFELDSPPADPDAIAVVVDAVDGAAGDVLPARWDPTSGRVVATTDHLSLFSVVQVDLGALGRRVADALQPETDSPEAGSSRPDCRDAVDVLGGRVELSAFRHAGRVALPVQRCLHATDSSLALTFHSISPLPWLVRWTGDARPQQVGAVALGDAVVLAGYEALARSRADEGLLIPGGTLTYHFDVDALPLGAALKFDGLTHLVLSLWYAFEMLADVSDNGGAFDDALKLASAVECLAAVVDTHAEVAQIDLGAFAAVGRGVITCATTALRAMGEEDVSALSVLMGIVGTGLPLLWGFIEAIVRTWDRSSTLTFSVSAPAAGSGDRGPDNPPTLSWDDLANRSYSSDMAGQVTLNDGRYQDDRYLIRLAEQHHIGDIDEDGDTDAVVVLLENDGGTGVFGMLKVLETTDSGLREVDAGFLGDRTGLKRIATRDGTLYVDLLVHGPMDGQCCPTQPKTFDVDIARLLAGGDD